MLQKTLILQIGVLLILTGCGSVNQGIVQRDGQAILQFSGDCEGVSFQIDDDALVDLERKCHETVFAVKPGKHIVTLFRYELPILERIVFFSPNMTSEILIP